MRNGSVGRDAAPDVDVAGVAEDAGPGLTAVAGVLEEEDDAAVEVDPAPPPTLDRSSPGTNGVTVTVGAPLAADEVALLEPTPAGVEATLGSGAPGGVTTTAVERSLDGSPTEGSPTDGASDGSAEPLAGPSAGEAAAGEVVDGDEVDAAGVPPGPSLGKNEPPVRSVDTMPAMTAMRARPMSRSGQLRLSQSIYVSPPIACHTPGRFDLRRTPQGRHKPNDTLPRTMQPTHRAPDRVDPDR